MLVNVVAGLENCSILLHHVSLSGIQIAMTSSSGRLTGKTAVVHCLWKQLFGKHYQQYDCSLELQKG